MLQRISIAAAALLAAGPVLAGGFAPVVTTPPPTPPVIVTPPPVVNTTDWSGFYLGGQLGFGSLSTEASDGDAEADFVEGDGALAGVHAGYMRDFGRIVAGAELDWDATNIGLDGTGEEFFPEDFSVGDVSSVARAKLRLGYDAGRFLPYVTAGFARASLDFDDPEIGDDFEDSADGSVFGLGVNFMASERFMVGIEALRHNFDDAPEFADGGEPPFDLDTTVDTLTLRGSFRF